MNKKDWDDYLLNRPFTWGGWLREVDDKVHAPAKPLSVPPAYQPRPWSDAKAAGFILSWAPVSLAVWLGAEWAWYGWLAAFVIPWWLTTCYLDRRPQLAKWLCRGIGFAIIGVVAWFMMRS